ncbi:hypothetical protein ONE63_004034 [Megalurothrips usitatus]|uniref:Regulatory protein zeste n=1 Tax=Megalurothrips usitatus TaxID=439358 RepID=A0AAV7X953_9NEOP|nr:hypothetical protein ONE63_004034 [Megalurothrips usitatus]
METVPASRRRKVNFSKREVRVLLQEVERLRGPLLGIGLGGNRRRGQHSMEEAWGHVAECVSAVAPVRRQSRDVRKKWADLKWAALRAGGHGRPTDPVSRAILRIIRGEATGLLAAAVSPSSGAADQPPPLSLLRGEWPTMWCWRRAGGRACNAPVCGGLACLAPVGAPSGSPGKLFFNSAVLSYVIARLSTPVSPLSCDPFSRVILLCGRYLDHVDDPHAPVRASPRETFKCSMTTSFSLSRRSSTPKTLGILREKKKPAAVLKTRWQSGYKQALDLALAHALCR